MAATEHEAYLGQIARRSFLSMWSFPNPTYSTGAAGTSIGKELCDLLVVFRETILVFSDKACAYPTGADSQLNWQRWYRRSLKKSIDQLLGARRVIASQPQRIHLDLALAQPFPLALPPVENARIFLLAVAHNSSEACWRKHGRKSLLLDTRVQADEKELSIGCKFQDDKGNSHFVHVLDDRTLDILLERLDTIGDFVNYLSQKQMALEAHVFEIHGEENLLAHYFAHPTKAGEYQIESDREVVFPVPTTIPDGTWESYRASPRWRHTQSRNQASYFIDRFIEHLTEEYIEGRMIIGQSEQLGYHERALRLLASETRFGRRIIASALQSIMDEQDKRTFWASTIPSSTVANVRYVFVSYPAPPPDSELERYEEGILVYLSQHLYVARLLFTDAHLVIGIGLPNHDFGVYSYVMRILDDSQWTQDEAALAAEFHKSGVFAEMTEETKFHVE